MNYLVRLAGVRGTILAVGGLRFLDEKYETSINDPPYFYKPNVDKASLQDAFNKAKDELERFKDAHEIPGVTCAIAVDDLFPYIINLGQSDDHFGVDMHNRTKIRIGEMSMVFTAAIIYHLDNFGFTTLSQKILGSQKTATNLLDEHWDHVGREDTYYKKTAVFRDGFVADLKQEISELQQTENGATSKKSKAAYHYLSWEAADLKNSKRAFVYDQYFLTQGFTNTCVDIHDKIKLFRSRYYEGDANITNPAPFVNPAHFLGVNGILSTAYDMSLFGQRLLANIQNNVYRNFLSPSHISKMFSEQSNGMTVFGKKTQNGDAYCCNNSLGASGILFLTGLDVKRVARRPGALNRKIAVAILANKEFTSGQDNYETSLEALARQIANCFNDAITKSQGQ